MGWKLAPALVTLGRATEPSSTFQPRETRLTELHDLSALELLEGYRQRTLSPREVVGAVLGHIERWEPSLRATYMLDGERALVEPEAAERRWQRRQPVGGLDGR